MENKSIGFIVGGGLKENFRVRLTISPQDVQEALLPLSAAGIGNTTVS